MNESKNTSINFINKIITYTKTNYKLFLSFIITSFLILVGYQYFSFYQKNDIHNNSITYFDSKKLQPNDDYYAIIKKLSQDKDFYSIAASLELINFYFNDKRYDEANELYLNLINEKDLTNVYIASIAAHASYNNLNVVFENSNLNLQSDINEFIEYIDSDLEAYKGIKLELRYLLSVSKQDINNISANNDKKTNELYKLIQETENVSSKIRERVSKIHEFQKYK